MNDISLIGASGFVGSHLIKYLVAQSRYNVRVLIRQQSIEKLSGIDNILIFNGDVMSSELPQNFLTKGCTVVNLAYLALGTQAENLEATRNIIHSCKQAGIRKLVHCSTAVVVGSTTVMDVDENTPCSPSNEYEKTKYAIEQMLIENTIGYFELVILRPTAIFGAGGKNLVKLSNEILYDHTLLRFIKTCLYAERKLNLLTVQNFLAAIVFIIECNNDLNQQVFIVSDDEYDYNNYNFVEGYLAECYSVRNHLFAPIKLPYFFLRTMLIIGGRTNVNPLRSYSSSKLASLGYVKPITLLEGLDNFASWWLNKQGI